jgi:phenylpyruvate tautomerase PptA (4-oxalocrotonate tautomerase family)
MPLTRIDLPKGKPAEYRAELLDPNCRGLGRSPEAILIQITFNEGRTVEQKQTFYAALVERLNERLGIRPQDVTINLVEVKKENWSFGNGVAQYVEQA